MTVVSRIVTPSQLEPYFRIAEDEAKKSPCIRRQYGSVIAYDGRSGTPLLISAHNERVGRCCEKLSCARDRFQTAHGQRVEVGGEIHSETAAVIKSGMRLSSKTAQSVFILVGFVSNGKELFGKAVYPCHSCALAIKFAGWNYIYIKNDLGDMSPVSVSEIIEYRESEWEAEHDV